MKIKDILNIELEDDKQDFGGVAFAGETVKDFIEDIELDENMELNDFNKILYNCGVKEINITKEDMLEILKKKLDDAETKQFMNQMVDGWTAKNYRIEKETNEEVKRLKEEISKLERGE